MPSLIVFYVCYLLQRRGWIRKILDQRDSLSTVVHHHIGFLKKQMARPHLLQSQVRRLQHRGLCFSCCCVITSHMKIKVLMGVPMTPIYNDHVHTRNSELCYNLTILDRLKILLCPNIEYVEG